MKTRIQKTAPLGALIAAAFDSASAYSSDPKEVSRLATSAVLQLLRRAPRRDLAASIPGR